MKGSIFYLDDEEILLDLFREMFGDKYEVRTASTLAAARRMLEEFIPDIIISDQKMPDIEGTAFLRETAQMYPRSYRILLTGQMPLIYVVAEITTGIVQQYIAKPWTEEEMNQALERAFAIIEHHGSRTRKH